MLHTESLWVGGAAMLAAIGAALWRELGGLFSKLRSLLVVTATVESFAGLCIRTYCWKNFRFIPTGNRVFASPWFYVVPLSKMRTVAVEHTGNNQGLFMHGCRPLLLQVSHSDNGCFRLGITFIRGTFSLNKLIAISIELGESQCNYEADKSNKASRFRIHSFRADRSVSIAGSNKGTNELPVSASGPPYHSEGKPVSYTWDDLLQTLPNPRGDSFSLLEYSPSVLAAVEEARFWLKSYEWYKTRGIPHSLGWLLYGCGGTGKTCLAKAIAQDLGIPLCVFDLTTMNNFQFSNMYGEAECHAPCVMLFEDFDNVFHGRENCNKTMDGNHLTFDCFLNRLSGVSSREGIFKIITTNELQHIDPAIGTRISGESSLSSRPGRLDRIIELGNISRTGRLRLARRICIDCDEVAVLQLVDSSPSDTPAMFQDKCRSLALDNYWKNSQRKASECITAKQTCCT